MNTYTIYLGTTPILCIDDTAHAYRVYEKTRELAEMVNKEASLVWDETSEEIASFIPEGEWQEPADVDDDFGFDPYAGCYTYDC